MTRERHHCPACSATLVADPPGSSLRCTICGWALISLAAWEQLTPASQGYLLYMQSSWPTSELKGVKNPYTKGTPQWEAFCHGERQAVQSARDGEE